MDNHPPGESPGIFKKMPYAQRLLRDQITPSVGPSGGRVGRRKLRSTDTFLLFDLRTPRQSCEVTLMVVQSFCHRLGCVADPRHVFGALSLEALLFLQKIARADNDRQIVE